MSSSKPKITSYLLQGEKLINKPELNQFLKSEGSIFQQIEFLQAFGKEQKFIVVELNGKLGGVLPLVKIKKIGIKAFHRPPYAHYYGPIIANEFTNYSHLILKELFNAIKESPLVEFKLPIYNQDIIPFIELGAKIFATQTHIVPYSDLYAQDQVHSSKRRYLKKLQKKLDDGGLIFKEGSDCNEQILWLQKQLSIKNGFRSYLVTMEEIMNNLKEDQAYSLLLLTPEGEPIAGAYCPYDTKNAYHLINASVRHSDSLLNRANILMTYMAVSKAMSKGLNFDFEGSNIPGIASFYRMMGGEPTIHYRMQIPRNLIGKSIFALKNF